MILMRKAVISNARTRYARRDFGPKQKVENPVKVFKRIMSYVLKRYPVHCLLVLICIVVSVYANVQGTMFMKTLIDGYITPLLGQANPDYSELLQAIIKMGILYANWYCSYFWQY